MQEQQTVIPLQGTALVIKTQQGVAILTPSPGEWTTELYVVVESDPTTADLEALGHAVWMIVR